MKLVPASIPLEQLTDVRLHAFILATSLLRTRPAAAPPTRVSED